MAEQILHTTLLSLWAIPQPGLSSSYFDKHVEGTLLSHTCCRTKETPPIDNRACSRRAWKTAQKEGRELPSLERRIKLAGLQTQLGRVCANTPPASRSVDFVR